MEASTRRWERPHLARIGATDQAVGLLPPGLGIAAGVRADARQLSGPTLQQPRARPADAKSARTNLKV